MGPGTSFQPVLFDPAATNADRVVLLTGKLYYDLARERAERGLDSRVALVRIEELCPFPFSELTATLGKYSSAKEIFWVQEEPRNQGAWTHVRERLEQVVTDKKVVFKGRKEAAVPATGVGKAYKAEQKAVVDSVFEGL
jgi:probable 2-oxoglutarate dehydrogenase E1 component DHKTD1